MVKDKANASACNADGINCAKRDGIAICGNILCDNVKIIESFPKLGMLVNICGISRAVGGCVPNTAISLATIDSSLDISVVGKCGRDEMGTYTLDEMSKSGIDISRVITADDITTGFSDVMTLRDTGERTFFHNRGANMYFTPSDIELESLSCRMLHIGYIHLLDGFDAYDADYGTVMARFLHDVKGRGISTSIDVVSRQDENFAKIVIPALKYTDNAIMNEVEACGVSGLSSRDADGHILTENIRKTMEMLFDFGVAERVIIHCPEAGFILNRYGEFTSVPSLKLPVGYIKGTVGAGDAFCAGCLYGIYHEYSDKEILSFASGAAACNLAAEDSVSGMRSAEYIHTLVELYKTI